MGASAERAATGRRILLKLSGELLATGSDAGVTGEGLAQAAAQIAGARRAGCEVAVVCGAGNIFRGSGPLGEKLPRCDADAVGMAATLVNALALEAALRETGLAARVFSAFDAPRLARLHNPRDCRACLGEGEVVILAGGTGNPYFTTDTAAALRALELECTLLIKGTKVDGVYDADPVREPQAQRFERLTYEEVLARRLGVMDLTAVTLCMENQLPIVVLDATQPGSVEAFLRQGRGATLIAPAPTD